MFERFTDRSRRVLVLAQEEARDLGHAFIGTEHVLLGLIREADGIAAKSLSAVSVHYDDVRMKVKERAGDVASSAPSAPPFTPRAKRLLELSLREALRFAHTFIGTEHLLLGLVREGEGVAAQILSDLGVDLSDVRNKVIEMMSSQRGSERSVSPAPSPAEVNVDSAILRGVVRVVGQQLRPDLGAEALDERSAQIAEKLFSELRDSWIEPDSSR